MFSRMGTVEQYWKPIPKVQASTTPATYIAISEFAAAEAKIPIVHAVR